MKRELTQDERDVVQRMRHEIDRFEHGENVGLVMGVEHDPNSALGQYSFGSTYADPLRSVGLFGLGLRSAPERTR